jgi:hypothetical protein
VSGGGGEGELGGVLSRLNAKQASLNRRRLKLYIKIFGAPYKGEGLRGKHRELETSDDSEVC